MTQFVRYLCSISSSDQYPVICRYPIPRVQTNHLDLESVEWLEAFLIEQNIPMIIVSHDREFLDRVCNKIVDAEGGICTSYDGNYSRFLELKKSKSIVMIAINSVI